MRIQSDYGNPVHGVSRQSPSRMFKGQSRELINCRADATKGLQSRHGWEFVANLVGEDQDGNTISLEGADWSAHERGDGTATITAYAALSPVLFNLQGQRQSFRFGTVGVGTGPQPKDYYLAGGSKRGKFGISSILDTMFMTNRTVVPTGGQDADEIALLKHQVWIEFSTFAAGSEWDITVGTVTYNSKGTKENEPNYNGIFDGWIPATTDKDDEITKRVEEFKGDFQAKVFYDKMQTDLSLLGIKAVLYNNFVILYQSTADQEAIKVKINKGGDSLKVVENREVKAIEDLPEIALGDSYARVIEGQGEERNIGYFKAVLRTGTAAPGVAGIVSWKETAAPSSNGKLDASTMPHKIVYHSAANEYVLETMEWAERKSGDKDSNPYNSFVLDKKPIQSIGLFQNRMFYAAGEVIATSAVDNYQDLWLESSFYNTDADPYEVYADTDKLNVIKFAAELDGDLVFFSENGQFLMKGDEPQTYKTAQVVPAATYKADLTGDPVTTGDSIMFATQSGSYAGVRELYTDDVTATKKGRPLTDHVSDYIKGRIRHMTTSTSIDAMVALTDSEPDTLYVYEWRWDNNQRQQQSWLKWKLPEGFQAEWVGFIANELYLVVKHTTGFKLMKMKWNDVSAKFDLPFLPRLDCMKQITGVYDSSSRRTTFNTPFESTQWTFFETKGSDAPGFNLTLEHLAGTEYVLYGDYSHVTLLAGFTMETYWSLNLPRVEDSEGVAQEVSRLQLGTLFFHFDVIGKADFKVFDERGRGREYSYLNRRMNNPSNVLNVLNTKGDTWKIPIRKNVNGLTLEMRCSYITPWVIRGVEWEGSYTQKGRRI